MLNDLKRAVCKANRELNRNGLVVFDWGSVSAFDMSMGLFVVKPIDVPFDDLQPELMVVMSMEGQKVEGRLEPEADVELHRAIYCSWPLQVGAVAHTHSLYATAFAQAGRSIPNFGTIHSRCFGVDVPITEPPGDVSAYDYAKGENIVRSVADPAKVQMALIHGHGPVVWGSDCVNAVDNAIHVESVAKLAYLTETLGRKK
jgi:L-ribulose-5-phosphate 4-epimerase